MIGTRDYGFGEGTKVPNGLIAGLSSFETEELYNILSDIVVKWGEPAVKFCRSAEHNVFLFSDIDYVIELLDKIESKVESIEQINELLMPQILEQYSLKNILDFLEKANIRKNGNDNGNEDSQYVSGDNRHFSESQHQEVSELLNAETKNEDYSDELSFGELLQNSEHSLRKLRPGQRIDGTIVLISGENIYVSFGWKKEGLLKKADSNKSPYKVGDSIIANVVKLNNGEGYVELSQQLTQESKALLAEKSIPEYNNASSSFEKGIILTGMVVSISAEVEVNLGNGFSGHFGYYEVKETTRRDGRPRIGTVSIRAGQKVKVRIVREESSNRYLLSLVSILDYLNTVENKRTQISNGQVDSPKEQKQYVENPNNHDHEQKVKEVTHEKKDIMTVHIPAGTSGIIMGDYVLYPFEGKLSKYTDKNNVVRREIPLTIDSKVKLLPVYVELASRTLYMAMDIYKLYGYKLLQQSETKQTTPKDAIHSEPTSEGMLTREVGGVKYTIHPIEGRFPENIKNSCVTKKILIPKKNGGKPNTLYVYVNSVTKTIYIQKVVLESRKSDIIGVGELY